MRNQRVQFGLAALGLVALVAGCASQGSAKRVNTADKHMSAGNYEAAARQYQDAQAKHDSPELSLRLATALIKDGRFDQALAELNRLKQESAKAEYLKAACYLSLNDVGNAKDHLEKSLKQRPNDALALSLLGRIHFLQQQFTQSAETYENALAASSSPAIREKLQYNLAMAQFRAGQFAQADQTFKQYLSKHEYVSEDDERLGGAIAYAAGDRQRALKHWQKLPHRERQAILNALEDDATTYQMLVSN